VEAQRGTAPAPAVPPDSLVEGLLGASPSAMVLLDADDRVAWLNDAMAALVGARREDVLGEAAPRFLRQRLAPLSDAPERLCGAVERARSAPAGVQSLEFRRAPDPGDPEGARWLEYTTRVLESGPLAGGRIEFCFDRTPRKRVESDLAARARQQAAVAELARQCAGEDVDLDALFGSAVSRLAEVLAAPFVQILELEEDGRSLVLRAGAGWPEGSVGNYRVSTGTESQAGYTLAAAVPVVVEDFAHETRFAPASLLREQGVASGITVSIGRERPFGVLGVHARRPRAFRPEEVELLETISNLLAEVIDRRRSERAERAHKDLLDSVLRQAADAILVCDRSGRLTFANDAARRLSGFSPQGRTLSECMALWGRVRDADGRPIATEATPLARALHGEVSQGRHLRLERRDGSPLVLRVSATPLRDEEGEPLGAVATVSDVTAVEEANGRLAESEARLRSVLATTPDLIHLVDREGRIQFANRTGTGRPLEEVLGRPIYDFLPEAEREPMRRILERIFEDGRPCDWEVIAPGPEGEATIYWTRAGPVFRDGEVVLVTLCASDVTEIRQAEETRREWEARMQAGQKLESLGVLAGGIAHDFNNLLVGVLGNASALRDRLALDSPLRAHAEEIESAGVQAGDLCRQMLVYAGKAHRRTQPLVLSDVVEDTLGLLRRSISKSARVETRLAPRGATVLADEVQLRQVILNLVTNAADAIGSREGAIEIRTGVADCGRRELDEIGLDSELPEGPYATLEVRDDGGGMSEAVRRRMFDPFFTTKRSGRGLGLSAVLGIVRAHRGGLRVDSRPQRGTRIRVYLPAASEAAPLPRPRPSRGQPWRGEGLALVADDEEVVRRVACRTLQGAGFRVLEASDGKRALELFRERADEIVLVVADVTMPEMGGAELLRELRALRPELPAVLTSGYEQEDVAACLPSRDRIRFLHKPWRASELVAVLRELCEESEPER